MLELADATVSAYRQDILSEDEAEIRAEFGFRKNISKYPLLYKELDGQSMSVHELSYIGLISRGSEKNVASLLIGLEDGRHTRICSLYLNEMQASEWGLDRIAQSDDDVDSLFD